MDDVCIDELQITCAIEGFFFRTKLLGVRKKVEQKAFGYVRANFRIL